MLLCDGHVHLEHQDFFPDLLDSCLLNMRKVGERRGTQQVNGILLIAELPGQQWRSVLEDSAEKGEHIGGKAAWTLQGAGRKNVIICQNGSGDQLVCVVGQQVNTAEKLELLLFGHDEPYCRESLLISVEKNVKQGSLVVIPWGVGKWLGQRGKAVSQLLQDDTVSGYFLGDNGNRPALWGTITQFTLARKKKIPIIAGTDPLFLPGQIDRVGGYGTVVSERPAVSFSIPEIIELLQNSSPMDTYGGLQSLHHFVTSQIGLRIAKIKNK